MLSSPERKAFTLSCSCSKLVSADLMSSAQPYILLEALKAIVARLAAADTMFKGSITDI